MPCRFARTKVRTATGFVLAYSRSAQPIALRMKNSASPILARQAPNSSSSSVASLGPIWLMIEVRRSPWKVLYQPDVKEVEHELLYDATRSFAMATADLKAASRTVQEILARYPAQLDANPELQERVQRNLIEPLERYEAAQERLLDILFETKP